MELGHRAFILLLAFLFFALIIFMYWIGKKYPSKHKKVDPIQKGIFLAFLLWGILFLAEAVGFLPPSWNSEHFYLHIGIAIAVVGTFMLIARRKKPLAFEKQLQIAKNFVSDLYYGEEYVGLASVRFLKVYKVAIEGSFEDTRGEVGSFIVEVKADKLLKVFVQINIYTGILLHIQPEPPQLVENRLLGLETPKKDKYGEQFDDGTLEKDDEENES